jgi:FixJ family two-component response regulator
MCSRLWIAHKDDIPGAVFTSLYAVVGLGPTPFLNAMVERRLIAIVDDDPSMLSGIRRLLNAYGFATEIYDSAEAFLNRTGEIEPHALVLDIHLGGLSGIGLRDRLASMGSTLPVIFITADDDQATQKLAIQAGCIACLRKPFSAKQLLEAIEQRAA